MSEHEAPSTGPVLTPARRAWIYRILVAIGALALFYGYITADALPLWLALATAVLGNGLAAVNTTTEKGQP